MYPVSSIKEINRNKIAICGTKITIPPIPGIIASVKISAIGPAGKLVVANYWIDPNNSSMKSINGPDQV